LAAFERPEEAGRLPSEESKPGPGDFPAKGDCAKGEKIVEAACRKGEGDWDHDCDCKESVEAVGLPVAAVIVIDGGFCFMFSICLNTAAACLLKKVIVSFTSCASKESVLQSKSVLSTRKSARPSRIFLLYVPYDSERILSNLAALNTALSTASFYHKTRSLLGGLHKDK
jgi:hypothetical protein